MPKIVTSLVSKPWAGWFVDVQQTINALTALLAVPLTVNPAPLQQDLMEDDGVPSPTWGLGYFQAINLALNACFVALALPDKMPPPQLLAPMLYPSLSNVGENAGEAQKFNPLALRLVWSGWFTAVYNAIVKLQIAAAVPVTITAPTLNAALILES